MSKRVGGIHHNSFSSSALRAERQKEGILEALQNGVAFGRRAKLTEKQDGEMRQKCSDGVLNNGLMVEYG